MAFCWLLAVPPSLKSSINFPTQNLSLCAEATQSWYLHATLQQSYAQCKYSLKCSSVLANARENLMNKINSSCAKRTFVWLRIGFLLRDILSGLKESICQIQIHGWRQYTKMRTIFSRKWDLKACFDGTSCFYNFPFY